VGHQITEKDLLMRNTNEHGMHEVSVGRLIHLWGATYGIVTEIRLINGKPAITAHYVSDAFPKKVTTFHGMFSELEEYTES
jgi:hypothetical protein